MKLKCNISDLLLPFVSIETEREQKLSGEGNAEWLDDSLKLI